MLINLDVTTQEMHTLRECMTVVLGGVQTGKFALASAALKRAEKVLDKIIFLAEKEVKKTHYS